MAACALLLAVAVPHAAADIGIRSIDQRVASTGQIVKLTASGYLGPRPWKPYPVAMISARHAPQPYPCRGGYCSPIRRLETLRRPPYLFLGYVDWRPVKGLGESGLGILRFRVPRVKPGPYLFALFCETCARGQKGSLIIDPRLVLRIR